MAQSRLSRFLFGPHRQYHAREKKDRHLSIKPTADSSQQPSRVLSRPTLIAAAFLALHVLPLFWRPNPLWGVDFLFYLPTPVQGLFILLAVLLFVPRFRRQCRTYVKSLPFALWGPGRRVRVSRILLILLAVAGFIALQSSRHFLGDGYLYLRDLDAGTLQRVDRAPLTFALIRGLHRVGAEVWHSAEKTYRIYSYASGLLYVLLAFATAGALGKTDREKSYVIVFLLTAGYVQLFFGYVENYAFYMPVSLLYLLTGLRCLENRAPLFVPALMLGLLISLHFFFVLFAPSLLVLAYDTYRRGRTSIPRLKNTLAVLAALLPAPLATVLLLWTAGFDFAAFLGRIGGSQHILPLFSEPGFYVPYRIVSISHLLDFINLQILAAPTAVMALLLVGKKDFRLHPFLLAAAAVPLIFTFIANPEIGAFRDWDILALPALPLTLWAASVLLARQRQVERRFRSVYVICAAAALHSILWIGVNANPVAAEARYTHLMGRQSGHAASYGWETLGIYYRLRNQDMRALNAYKRAIDASPENPRHWASIGRIYCDLDQVQRGIDHIKKALEIRPDMVEAHNNLATVYYKIGRHALAIEHLKKAIELEPDLAVSHMNLGAVYSDAGKQAKAIESLERAIALQPGSAAAHANLGAVYGKIGQYDTGIQSLERAVELQPDHAQAHRNLGLIHRARGRYPQAIQHFEKALKLQGGQRNAMAYLNIGDTYYDMREHEKAIPHFQKAIQLDPNHANAHMLLGLAHRALNRGDQARIHFEKTLELAPDHPQAAQIKQWLGRTRE